MDITRKILKQNMGTFQLILQEIETENLIRMFYPKEIFYQMELKIKLLPCIPKECLLEILVII